MIFSIITINYNNLEGLRRTIDSVMSQTLRDFEWIIVDGGSTDGSKDIIEQTISNPNSNVSWWCSEPDKGIYNAMNKGIAHAKGEYLNFMNSGDYFYDEETLKKVALEIEKNAGSDVYYGDHILYCGEKCHYVPSPKKLFFSVNLKYGINHQTSFIRRNLFDGELYDESFRICADWRMFIKWMLQGKNLTHIDCTICFFEGSGVSSEHPEWVEQEKEKAKNGLISQNLEYDFEEIEKYRYYPELLDIRVFLSKRRLFRKMCRCLITLYKVMSKIGF